MQKILILFILLFINFYKCFSQNQVQESHLGNFSNSNGIFLKKEFINLGKVKQIDFEKLKILDILNNETVHGLKITIYITNNSFEKEKVSVLIDEKELLDIESVINLILYDIILQKTPANYVEFYFTTLEQFKIGCYSSDKKWKIFLSIKNEYVSLNTEELKSILHIINYFRNNN